MHSPETRPGVILLRRLTLLAGMILCGPVIPAGATLQQPPSPNPVFHVVVAPGESLSVTMEGKGTPVVLLPGLVGSAFGYRRLRADLVEAGFQAIVIEPLGIGASPRPERANYSLTSQADRIGSAMERLELRNVIVVAHGVGGSMALRLAYRFPGAVRAIVSLEGGPAERAATPAFRRAMRLVPFVKLFGGVKLVRKKLREELVGASGDTTWITEAVVDGYTAGHARDLDGTLKAYLRMSDAREREQLAPNLNRVTVPVRLLIGQATHAGVIGREEIHLMTTALPDFRAIMVPGSGHYLHEERPDVVLGAVMELAQ